MNTHLRSTPRRTMFVGLITTLVLLMSAGPAFAKKDNTDPVANVVDAGTSLYEVAQRIGLVDENGNSRVDETGAGVIIAMIDTGVVDVPGLRYSNVVIGPDFSFEDQDPNLRARDTNGHGTHLAGIMVASDEEWAEGDQERSPDRTIGIAPDATVLSIKAGAANGAVDVTQVIAAINWVVEQKTSGVSDIDVLNLSFSLPSDFRKESSYVTDPLAHAVERAWDAGIVVVAAAGNEGTDRQIQNPAVDPFVIAVGASENDNRLATYSSNGHKRTIDVAAPGRSIISLRNPGSWSDQFNEEGRVGDDLVRASGTSQAAAVVSATAALLIEAHPDATPDQIKFILEESALNLGKKKSSKSSEKYLDAAAAVAAELPDDVVQQHERSDGSGSLDVTRGGNPMVSVDGVALTGDQDIFGNDWSSASWSTDAWTSASWSSASWSSASWSSASWSSASWSSASWSSASWSGASWSSASWSSASWSSASWSDASWSGSFWQSSSWT